jgi:hypothetical protein
MLLGERYRTSPRKNSKKNHENLEKRQSHSNFVAANVKKIRKPVKESQIPCPR